MARETWISSTQGIVAGNNVAINNPLGWRTLNLCGTARVTTTLQTSIPVFVRYQRQDKADEPMVIPKNSFVVASAWRIPKKVIAPTTGVSTPRAITGTTGNKILLSTAKNTESTPKTAPLFLRTAAGLATAIGETSNALVDGEVATADYGKDFVKWENPYANAANATAGLGTYSAALDADRTVSIYTYAPAGDDTTPGALGGGIKCSADGVGYGYPDYLDIPVFITVALPPICPSDYDEGVVVYDTTYNKAG